MKTIKNMLHEKKAQRIAQGDVALTFDDDRFGGRQATLFVNVPSIFFTATKISPILFPLFCITSITEPIVGGVPTGVSITRD